MKQCAKCLDHKPFELFNRNKNRKDGLSFWCKSCVSEYGKDRYSIKKETILQRNAAYRADNREKVLIANRVSNRKYGSKNPHLRAANVAKRRAHKLKATPVWLTKEHYQEIKEFYRMAKELETVFPWKQNVDHIVPLQGSLVSGLHVPWNLQISSEFENKSKGNRFTN